MKFTVITVVKNDEKGLRATIESVSSQLITNYCLEYLIIDGLSSDGTRNVLEEGLRNGFVVVSEPDRGLYDAMNKGIRAANGDYLVFMNAGDVFAANDVLSRLSDSIGDSSFDLIWGDALEVSMGNLFYKKAYSASYAKHGMFAHHQSIFYSNKTLKMRDLVYDERFRIAADYDLTLSIALANPRCKQVDFPVCVFQRGGISSSHWRRGMIEQYRVRRKHRIGFSFSIATFIRQFVLLNARRTFPGIWDRLRYRKL